MIRFGSVLIASTPPGSTFSILLFADIVGSTAMTENLDAEEAHELLYSP